jgi:hypothetical protein
MAVAGQLYFYILHLGQERCMRFVSEWSVIRFVSKSSEFFDQCGTRVTVCQDCIVYWRLSFWEVI